MLEGKVEQLTRDIARERDILNVIMENTGVMLVYFDIDFNFVRVNSAYAKGCGYTVEELIGKNHFDLFPDVENQAIFEKVRDTGKAVSFHDKPFVFPGKPQRGVTYWDWTLTPVKDSAGNVQGLVLSLIETTERRRAEEDRRIKDAAMNSSINGMAIADLNGCLTHVNPAFLSMLGSVDERELLGRNLVQFLMNREEALALVCALKRNGGWTGELSTRKKDGSVIDMLVSANMVNDEQGKPICVMASAVDVTMRKQAEEAVREVQKRVQRLFESSIIGIVVADMTGSVVEANDAFLNMVGYSREDLLHHRIDWVGMTPPEYGYISDRALEEISVNGSCTPFEKEYIRKDGTRVPVLVGAVLWDTSSDNPSWVSFVLDNSERKKAEQKLVTYERLATLGRLSGSISHELRNPLAAIDSSAFYLKNRLKSSDVKVQSHLERIQSNVRRCTDIIHSLLDMARMAQPKMTRFGLRAFTTGVLAEAVVPATVSVTCDFPDEEVEVQADSVQLSMAFRNIISNAFEAMGGNGTLRVKVCSADGMAEVSFADSGPGISPENMGKIFQPLFSTKLSGIGFGLAIASMVIDKHGGEIKVNSEVGKGATFTVRLPLYEDHIRE